uniref:Uncharacterized protein n=1 Tax=Timema tahoe TaxID=61484 RepID=A0A7R9ID12_9NEOP|nr:unnamed protein product [Timema tahoe]
MTSEVSLHSARGVSFKEITRCSPASKARCYLRRDRRHGSDMSVVVTIMLSCRHRVQQGHKITWNLNSTDIGAGAGTDTDYIGAATNHLVLQGPASGFYSSPMASLVLTDSSQADGFEKQSDQIMYPYAEPYDLQKTCIQTDKTDKYRHKDVGFKFLRFMRKNFCYIYVLDKLFALKPTHCITHWPNLWSGCEMVSSREMRPWNVGRLVASHPTSSSGRPLSSCWYLVDQWLSLLPRADVNVCVQRDTEPLSHVRAHEFAQAQELPPSQSKAPLVTDTSIWIFTQTKDLETMKCLGWDSSDLAHSEMYRMSLGCPTLADLSAVSDHTPSWYYQPTHVPLLLHTCKHNAFLLPTFSA